MCDALADLYQSVILDHGKAPRNFRRLEAPDAAARGDNPMCGDRVELFLSLKGDRIAEAAFTGRGCAVSIASASLLTEAVAGLGRDAARDLSGRFRAMARSGEVPEAPGFAKLAALSGVHEFPSRVKCATLPWVTLEAALAGGKEASSE
jgi:nitrogen fixation NifU-like protein